MKKFSLLIFFFFTLSFGHAQTMYVMHIHGQVFLHEDRTLIQKGDLLHENDSLIFQSADAKMVLLSSQKGRIEVAPKQQHQETTHEGIALLKDVLLPKKNNFNLSTRSSQKFMFLDHLQEFFEDQQRMLVEKATFQVNQQMIPIHEGAFFFLKYRFKGEEINKKLSFDSTSFSFIKQEILQIDGKAIRSENLDVTLYYFQQEVEKSTRIGSFTLNFPEKSTLEQDILIIEKAMGYESLLDHCKEYFEAQYGMISDHDLQLLFYQ